MNSVNGLAIPMNYDRSTNAAADADVIVVGAGPVGLLLALKLGLGGISTLVLEKHKEVLKAPRAIGYAPVVNSELKKIGVLEQMKRRAYQCLDGDCWRKADGSCLVYNDPIAVLQAAEKQGIKLPPPKPADEDCLWIIGQDELSEILFQEIELHCKDMVKVQFNSPCVGIYQEENHARVMVEDALSKAQQSRIETVFTAKWVVGADGAQSAVRQISCIPFEGHTWTNFRFTAADVEYKFDKELNYHAGAYLVDPVNWAVVCKTGKNDIWRVCYGEDPSTPEDDASVLERSKVRIPQYLSGANKDYNLRRVKPYYAQQRCAKTFRQGRVLLAGDAAHANNPVGGLGLTGGILDAVVYGNALIRNIRDGEAEHLIDWAAESRRSTWRNAVDPASTEHYLRLCAFDEKTSTERERFFARLMQDPAFALDMLDHPPNMLPDNFEK